MLSKKDNEIKTQIMKEKDSKRIQNILISYAGYDFVALFNDEEFMSHLRKYFTMPEDEAAQHVYIRKKERDDSTYK